MILFRMNSSQRRRGACMPTAPKVASLVTLLAVPLLTCRCVDGQPSPAPVRTYRLSVADAGIISTAQRDDRQLTITSQNGERTLYQRDRSFDSSDGNWLAYRSRAARQIIRWPQQDRGAMMIAAWNGGSIVDFRRSRMIVEAIAPAPTLPRPGKSFQVRLAPGTAPRDQWLAPFDTQLFELREVRDKSDGTWTLLRVSDRFYRIQCLVDGRALELAVVREGGRERVVMALPRAVKEHLWWIDELPSAPGRFEIRNLSNRDSRLAVPKGAGLQLLPVEPAGGGGPPRKAAADSAYRWTIEERPSARPASRVVDRSVRPGAALADAKVEFRNRHQRDLWVLLVRDGDTRRPLRLKIPAGESVHLALARDPGATLVETYEYLTRTGYERQDIVTQIPPATQYDASVYELIVQSISIDRTVAGGKVDNVNHAPKSVGWFDLPPLGEKSVIDVYAEAKSMRNPGAVRRIDISQWTQPASSGTSRIP